VKISCFIPGLYERIRKMNGFVPGTYAWVYDVWGDWGRLGDVTLYMN